MGRKGESVTLSTSEKDKAALETLAIQFEMKWGDRPNLSKLVEAIASRQLTITPNHDWSADIIQALNSARKALISQGKENEAREIAEMLRERTELSIPLRIEIETFLKNPQPEWRQRIGDFIHRQQPFRLSYRDAADRFWQYTVLHGQVEKGRYLLCRSLETEGNEEEIEELRHNRILYLDRIAEAAVVPIDRPWKNDFERILVEFHLFDESMANYEPSPEDYFVSEIEGDPPYKRIIRKISSSSRFIEDIGKYFSECVVILPSAIRDRVRDNVRLLVEKYCG